MTNPSRAILLASLAILASAHDARAGTSACWFENGALVVPASVRGAAGDYILDTGAAATQMHETRAQGEGIAETRFAADVRLAGLTLRDRPVAVVDLDARAGAFPTPIAGVLGADLLQGLVLDVSFAPCRVALYRPGEAPRWRGGQRVRMDMRAGLPMVRAAVSDGISGFSADFVLATGAPRGVRLDERLARVDAPSPELYPDGADAGRLSGLSLGGALVQNVSAGLLKAGQAAGAGDIGAPALARWRLRLDFARGWLTLLPARSD